MSGRLFLGSSRRFSALPIVACVAMSSAPALAQGVAETPAPPIAPAEPSIAPPAPDPPAPPPSEPAPPSQAPAISEPTPAATSTPQPAADPASPPSSAAFEPLPAPTREIAKPQPIASSPPPAPGARPQPAAHAAPAAAAKDDDDSGGLLGPFRIGVLVGTGLPEILNFGAQLKLTRFFGAGVNVGVIPTVRINYYGEAAQSYQEYDAYGHIYPFGGSFFLGAGVGYAQIKGTLVTRFNLADYQNGLQGSVDLNSDASVRTLVLTPQLGFLKIFDVGFAIGFDVGAQIPIAPSEVRFNTVAPSVPGIPADVIQTKYINPNDEKVRSTLNTLGRTPLPTFNFKIGWFL